jgi:uncharacterized protein YjbI with pentapeptide repeats
MPDKEHVDRLLSGVPAWNEWRAANPEIVPKLTGADLFRGRLDRADLRNARMHGANLNQASLNGAHLEGARLGEANLSNAKLTEARLDDADLTEANLKGISLYRGSLSGANLAGANLSHANLRNSWMSLANLERANLSGVMAQSDLDQFNRASLDRANLKAANLSGANFSGADLRKADLSGANLTDCVLSHAEMQAVRLDRAILIDTDLRHADLTGASIYGISAWSLRTEGAKQLDLVIQRSATDTPFTLDDIEVAQFIYMMLDNRRIRNVIDRITSKVVLILGRFGPERKAILDGLRVQLRLHNYLPIIFDFEKPDNRDLTETVRTLAHLARFVICDLTDAKSLPQELETIIPGLPSLPVQPIILSGSAEYAMFEHFERYPWVLPVVEYPSLPVLVNALQSSIIEPAERRAQQQIEHPALSRPRVVLPSS